MATSKFYDWKARYGKVNEHNAWIPRDHWLEEWEKEAIIDFHHENPLEGYRRLTFMMLDRDVVAASPSSVWRVLSKAGLLQHWNKKPSLKGTGFQQPLKPHEHWHVDVSYINISGTFYYLCSVLDGASRYIVHWEIRESMKEPEVEIILQRAREMFPEARPRVISDNGPQFIAKDFKEFIRICGMTHVKTSPYYPQSNGKIERWHKSIKTECIRPGVPLSLEDAQADRGPVGNPLQYGSASQRDRLHCAPGQAATTGSRDLRRTRSQTRSGSPTTTTAPQQQSGCDLWTGKRSHSKLSAPGEAEAGSAGTQPCRGIAWWAHRHDENGGMRFGPRVPRLTSSDDRPPCLKKSNKQMAPFLISPFLKPQIRQQGRASSRGTRRTNVDPGRRSYPPDHQPFGSAPDSYLTKNGTSPFHAEPRHCHK